jgi:hypothetical protein
MNRYFQISYPDSMFGDFIIWFINQHDNFFKPRGELLPPYDEENYQYGRQGLETPHWSTDKNVHCGHQTSIQFPFFSQRQSGDLVREGFPTFQGKTSDNPTIILIDEYYQMRLLPPGIKNPVKKKLHDSYYNETMVEKLDDLREELGMPDKIAFKNWWSLGTQPKPDTNNGHMSLPYDGISMIYVAIEDEGSIWYDEYSKRLLIQNERWFEKAIQNEHYVIERDFPSDTLTLNVDKFYNMERSEYDKLLNFIEEPPLEEWEEFILKYRTHLGVYLGET